MCTCSIRDDLPVVCNLFLLWHGAAVEPINHSRVQYSRTHHKYYTVYHQDKVRPCHDSKPQIAHFVTEQSLRVRCGSSFPFILLPAQACARHCERDWHFWNPSYSLTSVSLSLINVILSHLSYSHITALFTYLHELHPLIIQIYPGNQEKKFFFFI